MTSQRKRVVVAMSGGVDSSVAAALLLEAGYDVVGMMMRLWTDEAAGGAEHNRCCTPDQMRSARAVADQLGIPFYVLDTQAVFRETVVRYFIDGHRAGDTPNPCLACNRQIRFDWLLRNALALEADYMATGHYARVSDDGVGRRQLRKGIDESKDQSYVLSVLNQGQLSRALFPIGEYTKAQARQIAARLGFDAASKKDSQDLCFLGDQDYRSFLRRHAPDLSQKGPIVTRDGEILGEHGGLSNYTIGQRKGLGVSSNQPLYVLAMNPSRQALIVGGRDELGRDELVATGVNWISEEAPAMPFRAEVKIRYQATPQRAWIEPTDNGGFRARFDAPQRDITPGQAAVVYQGELCLGGGLIAKFDEAAETRASLQRAPG